MSPLDDELRQALQGRAAVLLPAADPLSGIERRAGRIRRTRAATAVAGSALAVAALALVGPVLTPTSSSAPVVPATPPSTGPTVAPDPSRAPSTVPGPSALSYALSLDAPWAYRGEAVPPSLVSDVRAALDGDQPAFVVPLFGQTYEPSGRFELVYAAVVGQERRWGVARASDAGPELVVDRALAPGTLSLAAALAGDEVRRLLVVASPEVSRIEYAPDADSLYSEISGNTVGVGVTALDGDLATDRYRLVAFDGTELQRAPAPGDAAAPEPPATQDPPANLLDWPSRGTRSHGPSDVAVLDAYAAGAGAEGSDMSYRPLFTGSTDGGLRFTFGQAWVAGRPADTVGLVVGGVQDQFFLGSTTPDDPAVLAYLVCCQPGSTVDLLVVVPQPGTGQVLYDDDATGELRPVGTGQDFLDGVVLVDRDPKALTDRLELLDGDGDLDRPSFEGPVASLLCARKGCG